MSKGQGDKKMKKSQEIIQTIKEQKELYIHEDNLTAQQISQEVIFIQDMESRAYAMKKPYFLEERFGGIKE